MEQGTEGGRYNDELGNNYEDGGRVGTKTRTKSKDRSAHGESKKVYAAGRDAKMLHLLPDGAQTLGLPEKEATWGIDEGIANALGCARMPSKLLIRGISGSVVSNTCTYLEVNIDGFDICEPRTSLDVGLPTVDEPVKTYDEYVTNRILENERLKKIADENYRDWTMMTKCQYDLANRDRFRKFEVGDLVLLESSRRKPGKTEKFLPKYVGPFRMHRTFNPKPDLMENVTEYKSEINLAEKGKNYPSHSQRRYETYYMHNQLEAAFGLAEISRDETKFQATVTSLDQPTLTYVADIVTAPPPSGKYDALKARLLQRLGQSKQTKILQVLDGRPMGEQKPSTVLAAMQHQAGRNFSDTVPKMLWTRRLPQDIRAALAASSETSLSKLAEMADNIHEAILPTVSAVNPTKNSQLEAAFNFANIASDDNFKYNTIIVNLDKLALICVYDIVQNPPVSGKYAALKERLLLRFGVQNVEDTNSSSTLTSLNSSLSNSSSLDSSSFCSNPPSNTISCPPETFFSTPVHSDNPLPQQPPSHEEPLPPSCEKKHPLFLKETNNAAERTPLHLQPAQTSLAIIVVTDMDLTCFSQGFHRSLGTLSLVPMRPFSCGREERLCRRIVYRDIVILDGSLGFVTAVESWSQSPKIDIPRGDHWGPSVNTSGFLRKLGFVYGHERPAGCASPVKESLCAVYPRRPSFTLQEFYELKCTSMAEIETYYKNKVRIGLEINLPKSAIVQALSNGVPRNYGNLLKMAQPLGPEEWLCLAQQLTYEGDNTSTKAAQQRSPRQSRAPSTTVDKTPPYPCRYCGGQHWHAQCQQRGPYQRTFRTFTPAVHNVEQPQRSTGPAGVYETVATTSSGETKTSQVYSNKYILTTIKDPTGRLFRWSLRLSAYDYEVKYLKGSRQYEADLLSRNPFCGFLSTGQIKDHQGELRRDTRYILNDKDLMTITRRAQYYWDGMTNDIRTHVRTCSVCQLVKPPKGPIYGELGQLPPAVLPYELVSLDTISGFAKYGNSQTFLHVVVDHATRYAWAFSSRSTSILTYTQVIKKVMQFGSPKRLLTDRAPAFTSPKFRRFLIRHNIGQLLTTSNNPQANGLSERLNATITGKLKLLRLQQPKTAWTKLLPQVLQAYNHTPHSVTGFPPSYLLLGSFPLQLSEHEQNYPKIDDARELAYQRTHERHLRDKARFDQTHRASDFEVGDLVLAKTYHHPDTGKLAPFFSGPYEILEIISLKSYGSTAPTDL
ncbi:hypothetical protein LAZ67_12002088 [Cordylochernes scorpioides]|uniref:RNA-directed DNA polymerase n=1 Tax=Cordylochernes scorpioides TaxID=51811 RepID=A0ABY6L1K0_9ARAC|nr:hypothetical protein LAZ67_12002088 [Cordylochernes scorpioides]